MSEVPLYPSSHTTGLMLSMAIVHHPPSAMKCYRRGVWADGMWWGQSSERRQVNGIWDAVQQSTVRVFWGVLWGRAIPE